MSIGNDRTSQFNEEFLSGKKAFESLLQDGLSGINKVDIPLGRQIFAVELYNKFFSEDGDDVPGVFSDTYKWNVQNIPIEEGITLEKIARIFMDEDECREFIEEYNKWKDGTWRYFNFSQYRRKYLLTPLYSAYLQMDSRDESDLATYIVLSCVSSSNAQTGKVSVGSTQPKRKCISCDGRMYTAELNGLPLMVHAETPNGIKQAKVTCWVCLKCGRIDLIGDTAAFE